MIPAELADRIDNLIHCPQRHPVHLLVQFIEAYDAFFQMEQTARDPGYWQYRLGKIHAMGYGVEQSDADAAEWYEQAVQWNNPFAAYALGSMYHYGQGVEKDEEKAFQYFKLAAEQGNIYAEYQLGQRSSGNEYDYNEEQTM